MKISELQQEVYTTAERTGMYEYKMHIPEAISRIHAEVSEAWEAYVSGNIEKMSEELADIIIMTLSAAEHYKINMEAEIIRKNEINKSRPYRHGKNNCIKY